MDLIQPNSKVNTVPKIWKTLQQVIENGRGGLQDLIVKPQNEDGYYVLTTGNGDEGWACLLRDSGEYVLKSIRGKFHDSG